METGRVAQKVALVTGAASGIGQATARLLAREGATVVVADLGSSATGAVCDRICQEGGAAEPLQLDVADESAWSAAMERILAIHRRLDVLVNNAGISISKPIADLSLAQWRSVMAVNLDGVFLGTRHAIQVMVDGGSIVNVGSVSGIKPAAGGAAYCASKAALRIFSKAAAIECADSETGIRINVVSPGGVRTPMWEKEAFFQNLIDQYGSVDAAFHSLEGQSPSHQFFSPEDVAQTVLYLASDESQHLTGIELIMDRGHSG
jgi:NAD(P)-dependent dehydrogenase (short-subunit alcohol dehydrogenase family)